MTGKTKVIFRKWSENGDVIALFPLIPATYAAWYCESFEHVGGHGGADPSVINRTQPATPAEYASLENELESMGYELEIVRRFPINAFDVRKAALNIKASETA